MRNEVCTKRNLLKSFKEINFSHILPDNKLDFKRHQNLSNLPIHKCP